MGSFCERKDNGLLTTPERFMNEHAYELQCQTSRFGIHADRILRNAVNLSRVDHQSRGFEWLADFRIVVRFTRDREFVAVKLNSSSTLLFLKFFLHKELRRRDGIVAPCDASLGKSVKN